MLYEEGDIQNCTLVAGWIALLLSCSQQLASLDNVFVTLFSTSVERASCKVHMLHCTGEFPTILISATGSLSSFCQLEGTWEWDKLFIGT